MTSFSRKMRPVVWSLSLGAFCACGGSPGPEQPVTSAAGLRSTLIEEDRPPVEQFDDPSQILKRYPPFAVVPRTKDLADLPNWPCTTCHDGTTVKSDPAIRELDEEHTNIKLAHGGGRYWCLTCHNGNNYDTLVSFKGKEISFDQPFLLCGQCHFKTQRDYFRGAHGKRVSGWNEPRLVLACPACHDPHSPKIAARTPAPAPRVRRGLAPTEHSEGARETAWERIVRSHTHE